MEQNQKSWSLYVFSSARVLKSYSMEQLVRLGISFVWMGLEGESSQYQKLREVDTHSLVGFSSLTESAYLDPPSSVWKINTPENINGVIDYAISHDTVFHQFMLYMPFRERPCMNNTAARAHSFRRRNFCGGCPWTISFQLPHRHIQNGQEEQYLLNAFTGF